MPKISDYPAANSLSGTELVAVDQALPGGKLQTVKVPVSLFPSAQPTNGQPGGTLPETVLATPSAIAALALTGTTKEVRALGYGAAGDFGAARYARVASQPPTGGIRSLDRLKPDGTTDSINGGWWAIDDAIPSARAFGAKGDGATDDTAALQAAIDFSFRPGGDQTNLTAYRGLFVPPGHYRTTAPLNLYGAQGAHIFGAGRFATLIENTAGTSVFVTNGFEYSIVERLRLKSLGSTALFDLNWAGPGSPYTALQSNSFRDIYFDGGAVGLRIAYGGYMGSENLVLNCYFAGCTTAGLQTCASNALQQTVVGGNFASCGTGIQVLSGSVPVIHGVGFQQSTLYDIDASTSGAGDTLTVIGCRSESTNFVKGAWSQGILIEGCTHIGSALGDFLTTTGNADIRLSRTARGKVTCSEGGTVSTTEFGRDDWVASSATDKRLWIRNIIHGWSSAGYPVGTSGGIWIDSGYVLNGTLVQDWSVATALSDLSGKGVNRGDIVWMRSPSASASPGWLCVTAGTVGSGAQFAPMAALGAAVTP